MKTKKDKQRIVLTKTFVPPYKYSSNEDELMNIMKREMIFQLAEHMLSSSKFMKHIKHSNIHYGQYMFTVDFTITFSNNKE